MQYLPEYQNEIMVFSKWTRKSYAIFSTLHRVVNIGRLSVDMCVTALCKKLLLHRIMNANSEWDIFESPVNDEDALLLNWKMVLLFVLECVSIEKPCVEINRLYQYKIPYLVYAEYGIFFIL